VNRVATLSGCVTDSDDGKRQRFSGRNSGGGVTLTLPWQKYSSAHPDGYGFTWFCEGFHGHCCHRTDARHGLKSPRDIHLLGHLSSFLYSIIDSGDLLRNLG